MRVKSCSQVLAIAMPDRAAEIAHKIEKTGRVAQFFRAEDSKRHIHGWRDAQQDRKSAQRMRPEQLPKPHSGPMAESIHRAVP